EGELRQFVQLQGERGGDAEVAAAPVQSPEQLRVLVGTRVDPARVGGDEFHPEQVVHGQAEAAVQPAGAAAQHEAADAGGGDAAAGGGEAVGLGGAVQPAHRGPAADAHRLGRGVDGDVVHQPQVDHQAAVVEGLPGDAVAAAAHRDGQAQLPAEAHGPHHVVRVGASRDHG